MSAWTYSAQGGYIGLWSLNGPNTLFDDFGGGTYSGSVNGPERAQAPLLAAKGALKPVSADGSPVDDPETAIQQIDAWAELWGWWFGSNGAETTLRVRHKALARPNALLTPGAGQTYRISYYAGSRLIAVREVGVKNSLNFMHLDHLGSPSGATNPTNGQLVDGSTTRYYPFGMPRPGFSSGQSFTDSAFTGQIADAYTGLMYYNARYYDPYLGKFTSADTIVPEPGNPQDLNRYAYVRNNPLSYVDPTGHDLMIVAGWQNELKDPSEWKAWIMAYKGWSEEQWTSYSQAFTNPNTNMDELSEQIGIRFFSMTSGDVNEGLLRELSWQMSGLADVTLIGHSWGANVILNYMARQDELGLNRVSQFITVKGPEGIPMLIVGGHDPLRRKLDCATGAGCGSQRELFPTDAKLVNIWSPDDAISFQGAILGAINMVSSDRQADPRLALIAAHGNGAPLAVDALLAVGAGHDHNSNMMALPD